jgi:hypothetical protein
MASARNGSYFGDRLHNLEIELEYRFYTRTTSPPFLGIWLAVSRIMAKKVRLCARGAISTRQTGRRLLNSHWSTAV